MNRFTVSKVLFVLVLGNLLATAGALHAGIVVKNVQMRAIQQVRLLGVDATLVAEGLVSFNFDVDANNNTIAGGDSFVDSLFLGLLPTEFGGLAGAPFELFSLPGSQVLTASGNGTHVRLDTKFGLRVLAAPGVVGANFYTDSLSIFESDVVSLTDFSGAVFQAPNRPNDFTEIFIGDSIVPGFPANGTLVGVSFNRTVVARAGAIVTIDVRTVGTGGHSVSPAAVIACREMECPC